MAASHGQSISRASVGRGNGLELVLPTGACAFKDLNGGVHAPTCGCRHFWLREAIAGGDQQSERAWCFCGHHACFHDNVLVRHPSQQQQQGASLAGFVPPTWSELIRDSASARTEYAMPAATATAAAASAIARPTTGLGIGSTSQPHSINTRLWDALNGFARQQVDGVQYGELSRLPSTAPLPSTAAPSVAEEQPRESPHRELQESISRFRPMRPPVTIPHAEMMASLHAAGPYSATEVDTEVATPSVRGTPVFTRPSPRNAAQATMTRQIGRGPSSDFSQPQRPSARPVSAGPSLSIQEMCNTIQNFGHRISQLESMSFDNIPSNEVRQRFEMHDGRLLDLEHWRAEQVKAQEAGDGRQNLASFEERLAELESWRDRDEAEGDVLSSVPQASGNKKRSLLPSAGSFESDGSFDLGAAQQTEAIVLATLAANAETGPRIDALETRISELENTALPSFARPWTIQVVLLPFGRQLPGVWFSSAESTQHSLRSGSQVPSQEWSATQDATRLLSFKSAATSGAWTTESIEAWARETQDEWLSPKACGPSGTVFQRLASRGLVREVELQAPDAGHIFSAISSAFGNILSIEGGTIPELEARYNGLSERYIPLRKVRKSSRLRFLSQAEMVTPATWSAGFLDSSVFMKSNGERRLYLTTPDGYLQPSRSSWSWQGLRNLPLYDGDGALQAAEALGKVIDACWSFTPRLDHVTSPQSSYASGDSPWNESVFKDFHDLDVEQDVDVGSPVARKQFERRSVSLPTSPSAHVMEVDSLPKRRVTSFDIDGSGDIHPSTESSTKRRRISTSPEWERRGFGITPRWSPPQVSVEGHHLRSSQAASSRGRGTTPFAMPTPRSHNDSRGDDHDDGDDDVSIEVDDVEEEWEGMPDAPTISPMVPGSRHKFIKMDEDVDQDDLDAGETIYEVYDEI